MFVKGKSGNPKGRPKRADTLSGLIEAAWAKKTGNKTKKQVTVEVLIAQGIEGNLKAIDMLFDRTAGKPVAPSEIDLNGTLEIPNINIVSK